MLTSNVCSNRRYLISYIINYSFTFQDQMEHCSSAIQRFTNILIAAATYWVIVAILKKHSSAGPWTGYQALTLMLFPTSFFFHFLYYTDSGSTFTVLLAYALSLNKHFFAASTVRELFY